MKEPTAGPIGVERARVQLRAVIRQLRRLDRRLQALAASLPRPADQDAMFDGAIPLDVVTELYGVIEFSRVEQLAPAVRSLQAALTVTAADLRRRFERDQVVEPPPCCAAARGPAGDRSQKKEGSAVLTAMGRSSRKP